MCKIILLLLISLLTACSNVSRFEKAATNVFRIDTVYCDGIGFRTFQDLGHYWSFVCQDGRKFIVGYK